MSVKADFSVMFTNLHTNHDTTEDSARVALQLQLVLGKRKANKRPFSVLYSSEKRKAEQSTQD